MNTRQRTSRCSVCGRYFRPDVRVKQRQRTCRRENCRRKRKQRSQADWLSRNPEYFKGRYEKVKEWRKARPLYQQSWRSKNKDKIQDEIHGSKPSQERELLIRAVSPGSEIQDEILSVRLTKSGSWEVGVKKAHEIQDKIARDLLCTVGCSP